MIQANELRLNNFVQDKFGQVFRVIEVNSCYLYTHILGDIGINKEFDFDSQPPKPIELTDEIILKCSGTLMFDEVHFEGMCMQYFKSKLYYSGGEGIKLSKEIQYVHQLQNLYFALTGIELKINL